MQEHKIISTWLPVYQRYLYDLMTKPKEDETRNEDTDSNIIFLSTHNRYLPGAIRLDKL